MFQNADFLEKLRNCYTEICCILKTIDENSITNIFFMSFFSLLVFIGFWLHYTPVEEEQWPMYPSKVCYKHPLVGVRTAVIWR